jgi:hypothetical protein
MIIEQGVVKSDLGGGVNLGDVSDQVADTSRVSELVVVLDCSPNNGSALYFVCNV